MALILDWLNHNSGVLQVLTSAGIAAFTIWYARSAWNEARRANERAEHPNVEASCEPDPAAFGYYDIVVRNAGTVPVRDVRLSLDSDHMRTLDNEPLSKLPIFNSTIRTMLPGREIRCLAFGILGKLKDPEMARPFTITATYISSTGRECQQSYIFDPQVERARGGFHHETMHDLVRAVKTLSDRVQKTTEAIDRVSGSLDEGTMVLNRRTPRTACPDQALRMITLAWKDFRAQKDTKPALLRLRLQYEAIHSELTTMQGSEALDEIRRALLEIVGRHYYWIGPEGDPEFNKLGESLVNTVNRMTQTTSD